MNDQWLIIIGAALAVFSVVGVGASTRLLGWLTAEADQSLLKLIIRVLLPCLIFTVVADNPTLRQPSNLVLPPLVGFGTVIVGCLAGWVVARLGSRPTGLADPRSRGTFAACVGIYNYGFVPIPLVKLLFDDQTLGVLFVHNVGTELAIWTLGVILISGQMGRGAWRQMINPPSLAILVALGFNFSGGVGLLPEFVTTALDMLGRSAVPMSLVLIGATIADELKPGGKAVERAASAKIVAWSIVLRLMLLPTVFLLIGGLLPASEELRRVIAVEAAMPSAVFPIVMARHYGGEPAIALRVVLATSLLSIVTIPIWISLGVMWLQLGG